MLRDREWDPGYTTDAGDLSERFYIPALSEAVRYDRGTAYFGAGALVRNMRGIEGLIRKKGKMRMLIGCTLEPDEIDAVRRGEDWKKQVEDNLCRVPLDPPDAATANGLELLSWMIASGHLVIRIAVRCDEARQAGGGHGHLSQKNRHRGGSVRRQNLVGGKRQRDPERPVCQQRIDDGLHELGDAQIPALDRGRV